MKAARILFFSAIFIVALAVTAMAATVNIQGAVTGTYTLSGMNIDSNGNVTLTVSGGTTPTPGGAVLGLSLSASTLPAGTQNAAYPTTTVTMTASGGTAPYGYTCSGSGVAGITATATGPSCVISGTPTGTGTYTVLFYVADSTQTSYKSYLSFSVAAAGGGGTSGDGGDPSSATILKYNDPNTTWQSFRIDANGKKYFKAVQNSQCTTGYKQLRFSLTYQQTAPNIDFIVRKGSDTAPFYDIYQTKLSQYGYDGSNHYDDPYFIKFIGTQTGGGETIMIPSSYSQVDTFYILVVNTESRATTFDLKYYCN